MTLRNRLSCGHTGDPSRREYFRYTESSTKHLTTFDDDDDYRRYRDKKAVPWLSVRKDRIHHLEMIQIRDEKTA